MEDQITDLKNEIEEMEVAHEKEIEEKNEEIANLEEIINDVKNLVT